MSCNHCRKKTANMLRCTKCKTTFYCDKKCQKLDWKAHKRFCSDDPAMRHFSPVEHAIDRAIVSLKKQQVDPPPDVHCFVCLEGGDGLLSMGCGCRGTSGFVHPDCLEQMAASSSTDPLEAYARFVSCATCHQTLGGVLQIVMMRKYWRSYRRSRNEGARRQAAYFLAVLLRTHDSLEAREYLLAEATRGKSEFGPFGLRIVTEQANVLARTGRGAEALDLLQKAHRKATLWGEALAISSVSQQLAFVLVFLGRHDEALAHAYEAVDIAQRAGCKETDVQDLKGSCATILAKMGRLQEAWKMCRVEVEYCERIYGPDHVRTERARMRVAAGLGFCSTSFAD
eukprot:CAMPEP_0118903478 /NCGR_PEP_ID=MMETSP1166-20130328/8328_1 /TAXON_ID=1104430 /ORGANISM="Chrysoreinhardia sp, Strain CCMP3193" /LENGTH=340 /DNA_ID=CAMNT_0006842705 /DNA_START=108 /DNA_END=1130 /DNA_ORIENTATION=+